MALYARQPRRRNRQLTGDVLAIGWLIVWGWIGYQAWRLVMAAAEPSRRIAAAVTGVRDGFVTAGGDLSTVPVAGEQLREPFDVAAGALGPVVEAARDQVRSIEQLAILVGLLVFALPAALVLLVWLPARVRFVRRSRELRTLLDSGADLDLVALRALATQPIRALARVGGDPVGDWRTGRWDAIVALAELELGSAGLGVPEALRTDPPSRLEPTDRLEPEL